VFFYAGIDLNPALFFANMRVFAEHGLQLTVSALSIMVPWALFAKFLLKAMPAEAPLLGGLDCPDFAALARVLSIGLARHLWRKSLVPRG
jgi:hypothetical protein